MRNFSLAPFDEEEEEEPTTKWSWEVKTKDGETSEVGEKLKVRGGYEGLRTEEEA